MHAEDAEKHFRQAHVPSYVPYCRNERSQVAGWYVVGRSATAENAAVDGP